MLCIRVNAKSQSAPTGPTVRCTEAKAWAKPFTVPSDRWLGAAALINMYTEPDRSHHILVVGAYSQGNELTVSHVANAQYPELQEDQQPYSYSWATDGGVAQRQILEWEHGVDDGKSSDADDEDQSRAKAPDDVREERELEQPIHDPI